MQSSSAWKTENGDAEGQIRQQALLFAAEEPKASAPPPNPFVLQNGDPAVIIEEEQQLFAVRALTIRLPGAIKYARKWQIADVLVYTGPDTTSVLPQELRDLV